MLSLLLYSDLGFHKFSLLGRVLLEDHDPMDAATKATWVRMSHMVAVPQEHPSISQTPLFCAVYTSSKKSSKNVVKIPNSTSFAGIRIRNVWTTLAARNATPTARETYEACCAVLRNSSSIVTNAVQSPVSSSVYILNPSDPLSYRSRSQLDKSIQLEMTWWTEQKDGRVSVPAFVGKNREIHVTLDEMFRTSQCSNTQDSHLSQREY